jgi:hypothetical protein
MNPLMQCPRCLVEKKHLRGLLRHLRYPCHLDTPAGRAEIARRRRESQRLGQTAPRR